MMLTIGSHINIGQIRKHITTITTINLATILCIFICLPLINNFLQINFIKSLIISTCLCLSSTMLCQSIINEHKSISRDYGQIAILGTIAQDLIGILCILYIHMSTSIISSMYETIFFHILLFTLLIFITIYNSKIKSLYNDFSRNIDKQDNTTISLTLILLTYYISEIFNKYGISKEIIFFITGFLLKKHY